MVRVSEGSMYLIVHLDINGLKYDVRIRGGTGECHTPAGGSSGGVGGCEAGLFIER